MPHNPLVPTPASSQQQKHIIEWETHPDLTSGTHVFGNKFIARYHPSSSDRNKVLCNTEFRYDLVSASGVDARVPLLWAQLDKLEMRVNGKLVCCWDDCRPQIMYQDQVFKLSGDDKDHMDQYWAYLHDGQVATVFDGTTCNLNTPTLAAGATISLIAPLHLLSSALSGLALTNVNEIELTLWTKSTDCDVIDITNGALASEFTIQNLIIESTLKSGNGHSTFLVEDIEKIDIPSSEHGLDVVSAQYNLPLHTKFSKQKYHRYQVYVKDTTANSCYDNFTSNFIDVLALRTRGECLDDRQNQFSSNEIYNNWRMWSKNNYRVSLPCSNNDANWENVQPSSHGWYYNAQPSPINQFSDQQRIDGDAQWLMESAGGKYNDSRMDLIITAKAATAAPAGLDLTVLAYRYKMVTVGQGTASESTVGSV